MDRKVFLVFAAVAIAAIVACAFFMNNDDSDGDNEPERIGIIGAMDSEVKRLKEAMDVEYIEKIAEMEYNVGKLDGHDVVIVQCGMGKVNAGTCAQMLISEFNAKAVINTGVAGSLDNRLDIGDFVVSVDAVQHDFDVSPIGFKKGEIPYTGRCAFEADESLRSMAVSAISACAPDINVMEGRVCSGDQFIATEAQKDIILANFGGLCCEMEGGAIAHICHLNDVPFVIVRAISDKADGSASEDYSDFEKKAAERSASMIEYMIGHMG